jgi:hypothetical protein
MDNLHYQCPRCTAIRQKLLEAGALLAKDTNDGEGHRLFLTFRKAPINFHALGLICELCNGVGYVLTTEGQRFVGAVAHEVKNVIAREAEEEASQARESVADELPY